jgi:hypothetical protein
MQRQARECEFAENASMKFTWSLHTKRGKQQVRLMMAGQHRRFEHVIFDDPWTPL